MSEMSEKWKGTYGYTLKTNYFVILSYHHLKIGNSTLNVKTFKNFSSSVYQFNLNIKNTEIICKNLLKVNSNNNL